MNGAHSNNYHVTIDYKRVENVKYLKLIKTNVISTHVQSTWYAKIWELKMV